MEVKALKLVRCENGCEALGALGVNGGVGFHLRLEAALAEPLGIGGVAFFVDPLVFEDDAYGFLFLGRELADGVFVAFEVAGFGGADHFAGGMAAQEMLKLVAFLDERLLPIAHARDIFGLGIAGANRGRGIMRNFRRRQRGEARGVKGVDLGRDDLADEAFGKTELPKVGHVGDVIVRFERLPANFADGRRGALGRRRRGRCDCGRFRVHDRGRQRGGSGRGS